MMDRVFRGALLGIFLGIVGGLAAGGLMYERQEDPMDATEVLALPTTEQDTTGDDVLMDSALQDTKQVSEEEKTPKILRFHIRANSDSEEDQMLKMEIKELVLGILEPVMAEASSMESAKRLISAKMPYIKSQTEEYMQKAGYNYNAEVYFTTEYFPLKQYGDVTFPAGNYEALRIDLGAVDGQNWWCVMYPSLCFVDATHAVLPVDEKDKLMDTLSEEEYNSLMEAVDSGKDSKEVVFYHSGIVDTLKKFLCTNGDD